MNLLFYLFNNKMPVQRGRDINGGFYRWGNHGAKYYYISRSKKSRQAAFEKAALQGRAIQWRKNL
jgi:hypothetical protein